MKIFKKSLQIFTAISIFALVCTSLNAAVTITQDDLSGNFNPDLKEWYELKKSSFSAGNYVTIGTIANNWGCTYVRMTQLGEAYLRYNSYLTCVSEMPIGTIWMLVSVDAGSQEYVKTINIELGKRAGRGVVFGDAMLNTYPEYTNTIAGTAIMSTAVYTENVYKDEKNNLFGTP